MKKDDRNHAQDMDHVRLASSKAPPRIASFNQSPKEEEKENTSNPVAVDGDVVALTPPG